VSIFCPQEISGFIINYPKRTKTAEPRHQETITKYPCFCPSPKVGKVLGKAETPYKEIIVAVAILGQILGKNHRHGRTMPLNY
jgi:hypothetical protein